MYEIILERDIVLDHSIEVPRRVFKHGNISEIPPIPDWLSLSVKQKKEPNKARLLVNGHRQYLTCKNRHNVLLPREQMTLVGECWYCPDCMAKRNAKARHKKMVELRMA